MDTREFLDVVAHFATGITVITTKTDDAVHGMTANAFTSLSLAPMQIIVCLSKKAKMAEWLQKTRPFTVNILAADQDRLSTHFAGVPLEPAPPIRFIEWEGGVRLDDCLAAVGCRVAAIHDGGDHWVVVGKVVALHRSNRSTEPLLYFRRKYAQLEPTRTAAPARSDFQEGTPMMFYDPW